MLIANVKSQIDLQAKKNLQKELLDLEVSNELENQRRRKEAGITTYEPAKILAQYRTSAEIQADRASAEQEARKHFDDLGFGFQEASQLVTWLSSSFINRLNDFNANAKGIKTEITKNFSPTAYKNIQFVQNFLERYFDELDVNYGKKFGTKDTTLSGLTTLNQIGEFLPKTETINNIVKILDSNVSPSVEKDLLISKLKAVQSSSLTTEMINNLNASLTQGERSNFTRKLLSLIRRSQFVSQKELKEIEKQLNSEDDRLKPAVVNKLVKLLSEVDSKKPFVNVVEFTKQFLDSINIQERQSYQDSNLTESLNDSIQEVARDLERIEEIKRIKILEETEPFGIEEIESFNQFEIPKLNEAVEEVDLDSYRFFTEQEIEALKKIRPILKNKNEATKRREIIKVLDRLITTVEVIVDGDKWFDEFKEDITNDRSKGASVEANKEQITEFLVTNPSAPAKVDKLIPALEEEQTAFASEVVRGKAVTPLSRLDEVVKSYGRSDYFRKEGVEYLAENLKNFINKTKLKGVDLENEINDIVVSGSLRGDLELIGFRPNERNIEYLSLLVLGESILDTDILMKKIKEKIEGKEESFGVAEEAPSAVINDYIEIANKEVGAFVSELRQGKTGSELVSELKRVIKEKFNVKAKGKNQSTLIQELRDLHFQFLVDNKGEKRTRYIPSGRPDIKVGLGIRRQRINQKLARHFKEDEKLLKKVARKLQEESSSESEEETEKLLKGHTRRTAKADKIIEKKVGKGWFSNTVIKHLNDQEAKKEDQERKTLGFSPIGDTIGKLGIGLAFRSNSDLRSVLGGREGGVAPSSREVQKGGLGREPSVPSFNAKRIPVTKVGKGIEPPQEIPTYREFGKYRIHVPQLLNNNTANFKYPSLGGIPTLKPQTISQDYKEFLIDLLNTGKFSERELKRLPQREIKHFERVVIGAGLVEKFGLKVGSNDEDKQDAERFELLKGEYLAGNNNEKLLKELRALVVKFINNGRLIKSEGHNLLLQLSSV